MLEILPTARKHACVRFIPDITAHDMNFQQRSGNTERVSKKRFARQGVAHSHSLPLVATRILSVTQFRYLLVIGIIDRR
jgi:hypothetical protein